MKYQLDDAISLEPLQPSDATDIFRTIDSQRDYLGKWLPFVEHTKSVKDSEQFVDSVLTSPDDRFEPVYSIRKKGEFLGLIGFVNSDLRNRKTEIGYWISEKFQKQGIMTRCVKKLCEIAFEERDMNRIVIKCACKNTESRGIPERLGFQLEGIERQGELLPGNVYTDLAIYSKLKHDK
ncbi:MAG: GNAT family N-acetyltransferase [FCB group bacterium]|nr:GNAT family N-acetyltransferase [FCB group bacterium]